MGGAHGEYSSQRNTDWTCECKECRDKDGDGDNCIPGHKYDCHRDNFHYHCRCLPRPCIETPCLRDYIYHDDQQLFEAISSVVVKDSSYTNLRVGINLEEPYQAIMCWAALEGMPYPLQLYPEGAYDLNTRYPRENHHWFSFWDESGTLDGLPEETEIEIHYIIPGPLEEIIRTSGDFVAGCGDYHQTGWAYGCNEVQLPVELQAFWAEGSPDRITLRWITASEQNTSLFRVYRAASATGPWQVVHEEEGHGTTSERHEYSWSDFNVVSNRTYFYLLADVDMSGTETRHEDRIVQATPGVQVVPSRYALYQNRPNPFNPSTEIVYELKEKGQVTLKVFNLLGQEIATLVSSVQAPSRYVVHFDAGNLPSGVYLYSLQVNDFYAARKMVVLK